MPKSHSFSLTLPPRFRRLPIYLGAGLGVIFLSLLVVSLLNRTHSPNPQAPITLVYWGLRQPDSVFQEAISDFETQNPGIKIKYSVQSDADYRERLQTALSSGQGPDIFRFHNTWVSTLSRQLAVVPNSIYSPAEFASTFYPVNQAWLKTRGGFVGIPLEIDGLGLYYNTAIFSAAGLTPPKTPSELRSTAKLLTIRNNGLIARGGISLGTTKNVEHWPDFLGFIFLQNGADILKPNTVEGQGAVTFYTLFSTEDEVWNDTLPPSTYAFATEKAAMMVAPSWRASEVKQLNPNLQFAIAPLPQLPHQDVSWASYWVEGVSASAPKSHQEAAWKWLKFLSQKETLRSLYAAASTTSLIGMPFSRVDMADQLVKDQYIGAYIVEAPFAQSGYVCSFTYDNGYNDNIIALYKTAVDAVLQGNPASEVLGETEDGIQAVLHPSTIRRK